LYRITQIALVEGYRHAHLLKVPFAYAARYDFTFSTACLAAHPHWVRSRVAAYRRQQRIFVRPDLILDIERRVRKELTLQRLLATARRAASVIMPTVSRTGPKPDHIPTAPSRVDPDR
jgi:hypothetical protein